MRISIRPYLRVTVLRWMVGLALLGWSVTASVYALRNQPKVILIGLDENGTRLISSANDPLLDREKAKFVRDFLFHFYNYTSATYRNQVSRAGDLMSDALWTEKRKELERIAGQAGQTELTQDARLLDLRDLGEQEYEADLAIRVKTRLVDRELKYRVSLRIGPRSRNSDNPYAWEVTAFDENEIR